MLKFEGIFEIQMQRLRSNALELEEKLKKLTIDVADMRLNSDNVDPSSVKDIAASSSDIFTFEMATNAFDFFAAVATASNP